MNPFTRACVFFFLAWLAYWIYAGLQAKKDARRQSGSSLAVVKLLEFIGGILVFSPLLSSGLPWLRLRILPDAAGGLGWLGLGLCLAGLAFTIWARLILAGNWSSWAVLKEGHELVQTGPYALVRNPIYSGLLLCFLGVALTTGELHSLLGLVLAGLGFGLMISLEEGLLRSRFPQAYADYARRVKRLVPFIY